MIKNPGSVWAFIIFASILLLATFPIQENKSFHSQEELDYFKAHFLNVDPVDPSIIFPTFSTCEGCHGYDRQMNAMLDANGNDVNVVDNWRATMMANSAKDPFWRAKVSHEILLSPADSLEIQTKCTSCHAPNGHYTATLRGAEHYTIHEMLLDTIAMDGVSCASCHMIAREGVGQTFSGLINYDTNRVMYGPYDFPFEQPMSNFVGFKPVYSEHINDAGICAPCHTLITDSKDLQGQFTGEEFVEQATYHEWLNSAFAEVDGPHFATCQSCHMPRIEDSVVISSNYIFLEGRSPFAIHELVGGNTTMLKLMKEHKDTLGINAQDEHFDNTIANTFKLLTEQSAELVISHQSSTTDSAFFNLDIKNLTGHKFPSGYPSRRAFIEFVALTEQGDTLFHSGQMHEDYSLAHEDNNFEPHHKVISKEDQVQIYEMVPLDVTANFTTGLERAFNTVKDNRLPPLGFTKDHFAYDTTMILGRANSDLDFNLVDGEEGTGSDALQFHIAFDDYEGLIQVYAKMYYQPLPPKWMKEIFEASSMEIEFFKSMFENADQAPVLIDSVGLDSTYVSPVSTKEPTPVSDKLVLYPNPSDGTFIHLDLDPELEIQSIELYSTKAQRLKSYDPSQRQLTLNINSGIYFLKVRTYSGILTKKLIVN